MSSDTPLANWLFVALRPAMVAAFVSLVVWLLAAVQPAWSGESAAGLTAAALLAIGVSIGLRKTPVVTTLPHLAPAQVAPSDADAVVEANWVLCLAIEANAIGCLAMLLPNWLAALPLCSVVLATEATLWPCAPKRWRSKVAEIANRCLGLGTTFESADIPSTEVPSTAPQSTESPTASVGVHPTNVHTLQTITQPVSAAPESNDASPGEQGCVQTRSEEGRLVHQGWSLVSLAGQQKAAQLAIAFPLAFRGVPCIELDVEEIDSEVDTEEVPLCDAELDVVHATPSGMRLSIRRHVAHHPVTYKVLWYAIDPENSDESSSATLTTGLP